MNFQALLAVKARLLRRGTDQGYGPDRMEMGFIVNRESVLIEDEKGLSDTLRGTASFELVFAFALMNRLQSTIQTTSYGHSHDRSVSLPKVLIRHQEL